MAAIKTSLNRKDLLQCLILAALCLLLFRDIIFGGHMLFGDDFVSIHLNTKQFLYNEIHSHHSIPFWNPYIFGGIPFWAHFESTIFYPLGFLFWFFTPDRAYGYTMLIHLMLAGIFMYILARSFGIGRAGSFVAATAFTFNDFVMATLYDGQMFRVQSYMWIPLIIYFLNRALTLKKPYFNVTMAGLFWGIQVMSGAPQDAYYTFLAALLFLLCNIKRGFIREVRYNSKILTIACLVFAIGSCIAAIQLVPAFEFIDKSVRAAIDSYNVMTRGSYPPEGIITAVLPHFFGNYVKGNFWVSGVPWSIPLYNLYVGTLPLILFFFISYRQPTKRRIITFALGLAIVAFLFSLGSHTFIYKLVYLLPGFDRIRAPSKIIILWVFALSLLAGRGMDDLFRHNKTSLLRRIRLCVWLGMSMVLLDVLFHIDKSIVLRFFSPLILYEPIPTKMAEATNIILSEFHRFTLFSFLIVMSILLWIRGILKHGFAATLLCVLLLIDLGVVTRGAVQHNDKIYHWAAQTKNDLDMTIGKDKSIYRVGSYNFGMGANIEMYLGYQTVGGYGPLFLHRYYEYINKYRFYMNQVPEGWIVFFYDSYENIRLMDLLNVKYEISHADRSFAIRKTFLPRAFIVPDYKIVKKEQILDYLIRPDFDPTRIVLFEKEDFQNDLPPHTPLGLNTTGKAKVISYRPDNIVIETDTSNPGYLFLSESYYPGWKAFVDDQPTRILRGNYLFRVVELPEGHHVVRFTFDPLSIKVGISVTIFTLFMILIIIVFSFRKRITFISR